MYIYIGHGLRSSYASSPSVRNFTRPRRICQWYAIFFCSLL